MGMTWASRSIQLTIHAPLAQHYPAGTSDVASVVCAGYRGDARMVRSDQVEQRNDV